MLIINNILMYSTYNNRIGIVLLFCLEKNVEQNELDGVNIIIIIYLDSDLITLFRRISARARYRLCAHILEKQGAWAQSNVFAQFKWVGFFLFPGQYYFTGRNKLNIWLRAERGRAWSARERTMNVKRCSLNRVAVILR